MQIRHNWRNESGTAARKQIEASKASEHNALNELKRRRTQIEDMQAILELANKKAQATNIAKVAFR